MSAGIIFPKTAGASGHIGGRANFIGGPTVSGSGEKTMFGKRQREWEAAEGARKHTGPGGHLGIGFMAPVNEDGKPLTKEQMAAFEVQFGGRTQRLNSKGQLRFVDTDAFIPTLKDNLEKERYLSQLSTFLMGGSDLMSDIFGEDLLKHCKSFDGGDYTGCPGITIPAGLAKYDCTPDMLRLFPPETTEWNCGSAKLRAILSTMPIVTLGELPSCNTSLEGAGERTDIAKGEASKPPAPPAEAQAEE